VQEHQHLADLGKAMHSLITMINRVLAGREDQLGESFDEVHGLTKDFRAIVGVLHNEIVVHKGVGQMLRDGQVVLEIMRKDVPSILSKLDQTLASMEQLAQRGSKILESEGSAALMSDITTSVEHLKSASKDMKTMMGSLKKGEGTLGALIRDDELFKDLRYVVKELKERPWKLLWRE
jgi:phospholipid/cholesterol/gamma-HCH transport system substrate-binding protein